MTPRRILVADDEPKIVSLVSAYLAAAGYEVLSAADGAGSLELCRFKTVDCAILDINMPGMDGLEAARRIRSFSDMPIIFLTARVEETDRVVGLELGADDYVLKPFSPRELVARVRAVLRRYPSSASHGAAMLRSASVVLDTEKREVWVLGSAVTLTRRQFDLLHALMGVPGRVLSRKAILDAATDYCFDGYERTVDAHVKNLRKALGDDGDAPRLIGTVRGVGYKWIDPPHEA